MNRIELAKYLKSEGISDRSISFVSTNEKYCLVKDGDEWCIFFDERRDRTFSKKFKTEESACEELLKLVRMNQ